MSTNDSSDGMAEWTKNKLIYSKGSWIGPTNEAGKSQNPHTNPYLFIYLLNYNIVLTW